jgi:hypothetical protein
MDAYDVGPAFSYKGQNYDALGFVTFPGQSRDLRLRDRWFDPFAGSVL